MDVEFIPFEACEPHLDWIELTNAIVRGHEMPKASVEDSFLYRGDDTLLSRNAWIDGLGIAVKSASIFPGNSGLGKPSINGGVCLYSDDDGILQAVLDFHLVTKWKTAGDSLLAARRLARKDTEHILIVGAGTVARSLRQSYGALFPDAEFKVWSRTDSSAQALADDYPGMQVAADLKAAVHWAHVITCATMSHDPVIRGDWLRSGQHVDLIGAYRPDMREADDRALQRARIFVDSRETVLEHIGELKIPLESGAISTSSIIADFYDLGTGAFERQSDGDITLFKNGGGAHLDLMTCCYILDAWRQR